MQIKKDKTPSRREFLKIAASIAGTAVITGGTAAILLKGKKQNMTAELWRLNPAFRMKEVSLNTIELFTHLGNGEKLQHRFTGVEADLLRVIAKEKRLDEELVSIAKRHHLSIKDCKTQLNLSIREFEESRLIYSGEKMLVKIVEVTNG